MKISLDKGAYMPERAHAEDAGLDLKTPAPVLIKAGGSATIDTGVHIEIPHRYFGKIESKSGLNHKHGLVPHGGVIDEGYTGSIKVKLYNHSDEDYMFASGGKIAQLVIIPCIKPELELVKRISGGERGENGFGSTGR